MCVAASKYYKPNVHTNIQCLQPLWSVFIQLYRGALLMGWSFPWTLERRITSPNQIGFFISHDVKQTHGIVMLMFWCVSTFTDHDDVRTWSSALLALICSCCYPEQAVWHHSNAFDDALPDTLRLWHSTPHSLSSFTLFWMGSWLILGLRPSNKRRRYFETASLIGWAQT